MPFDHVAISVTSLSEAKAFYTAALAPLGYKVIMEFETAVGLGAGGVPDFWLGSKGEATACHLGFKAASKEVVDQFYEAAMFVKSAL
jgi:catechol 2,3-dioxygenase-like lactoylglutathione lyase family enzyme